jgi:hypothetical protein
MTKTNPFEIWLSTLRSTQPRTPSPIASLSPEVAND